jgi:membrane protein YdbS with pleckstrin-like domain
LAEEKERRSRRGYLNPRAVRRVVFWTTSTCIFVAVVASLMAIWEFTGTDVLWRTVATCAVIGTGMMAFFVVNSLFDWPRD